MHSTDVRLLLPRLAARAAQRLFLFALVMRAGVDSSLFSKEQGSKAMQNFTIYSWCTCVFKQSLFLRWMSE
jgi:hypothetical protein